MTLSTSAELSWYQIQLLALAFWVTVPGLTGFMMMVFNMAKTDFWCLDDPNTANQTNFCPQDGCSSLKFDKSFWDSTLIMDFQIVCSNEYLLGTYLVLLLIVTQKFE